MYRKNLKNVSHIKTLKGILFVCSILIIGCAKEMEDKYPDNFQRDVHAISSFSESGNIQTVGDTSGQFAFQAQSGIESGIFAVNEKKLYGIKVTSGPSFMNSLFKGYKVEASSAGENFRVSFKLNKKNLTVYLETTGHKLSAANKQLTINHDGNKKIAIFHLEGNEYGKVEKEKNAQNEETNKVIFKKYPKAQSTHIKLELIADKRVDDGLRGMTEEVINLKSLTNRMWSLNDVYKLYNYLPGENAIAAQINTTEKSLKLKVIDGDLYIFSPVKLSELNILEKMALREKDPRIMKCQKEALTSEDLKNGDLCVYKSILKSSISKINLKLKKNDEGEQTGSVELENVAGSENANFVIIPSNTRLLSFSYDKVIAGVKNQEIFGSHDFQAKVWKTQDLSKRISLKKIKGKIAFTKIINGIIYVLTPVEKSSLHKIEQDAATKDPRYAQCSKEILVASGLKEEDCILRPQLTKRISYGKLSSEKRIGQDSLDLSIQSNITQKSSHFFTIAKNSKSERFDYMESIPTANTDYVNKQTDIDLDAEYIYLPSTHGTPREVLAIRPFVQGGEKIVKLRFSKDGLEVYEPEKDSRFQENPLNNKPVLTIPGNHIDYKCSEDANGKCTSGVQSDQTTTWENKRFFNPRFADLSIREINDLDIFSGDSECISHIKTRLVKKEVVKGSINIELEKTYKTHQSEKCIVDLFYDDKLSVATFNTRFHYSIVKLDSLISKDYKTVSYPIPDHDKFGFFKSKESKLNDGFDTQRMETKYFLNRWNPKRKEIIYHLSDTFNSPGQEAIKKATYASIKTINRTLRSSNAGIQIKLMEPSGKLSGDLRYNTITLITDPLDMGLLGYAPTVTNPRTGEIIQGHINMYSGTIQSMGHRIWNSMSDLTIEQKREANEKELQENLAAVAIAVGKANQNKGIKSKVALQKFKKISFAEHQHGLSSQQFREKSQMAKSILANNLKGQKSSTSVHADEISLFEKKAKFFKRRLEEMSENSAYAVEFFKIAGTVKTLLPGIKKMPNVLNKDGTLKRWSELNQSQKEKAYSIISPFAYTSTLVHEFGHNLGLRHNFIGSFDAANFYSETEAKSLGLRAAPAYSSVMDYAGSELNELTVYGKYDSAALRFAYAREVETKDGSFVKLPETLFKYNNSKEKEISDLRSQASKAREAKDIPLADKLDAKINEIDLKTYLFCTDGNAGLNSTCNRFDEGTTMVEVVTLATKRYENNYKYRNFRNGRDNFRAEGLGGYLVARHNEFRRIRGFFEDYQIFAGIFGDGLMAQGCNAADLERYPVCAMINDRRDAVKIAADFFLKVLKTPDHLCAVAKKDAPDLVVELKNLSKIYSEIKYTIPYVTTNCFDPAVKEKLAEDDLIVVGEAGKFLNGFKGNHPKHIYSNDRSTRGIWMDKILAIRNLFQRGGRRKPSIYKSFVDHTEIGPKVKSFISHLVVGSPIQEAILFKKEDGSTFVQQYNIDDNYMIDEISGGLSWVKEVLSLPSSGKSNLTKVMLKNAVAVGLTQDQELKNVSRDAVNFFTVRKADIDGGIDSDKIGQITIEETIFGATPKNELAFSMINSAKNLQFFQSMKKEEVQKILDLRKNPTPPAGLTNLEKVAMGLETGILDSMIGALRQYGKLELEFLIKNFGEKDGTIFFKVSQLGIDKLLELKNIKISLTAAPADATDEEKILYSIPLNEIEFFLNGVYAAQVEKFNKNLFILPMHVKEVQ